MELDIDTTRLKNDTIKEDIQKAVNLWKKSKSKYMDMRYFLYALGTGYDYNGEKRKQVFLSNEDEFYSEVCCMWNEIWCEGVAKGIHQLLDYLDKNDMGWNLLKTVEKEESVMDIKVCYHPLLGFLKVTEFNTHNKWSASHKHSSIILPEMYKESLEQRHIELLGHDYNKGGVQ